MSWRHHRWREEFEHFDEVWDGVWSAIASGWEERTAVPRTRPTSTMAPAPPPTGAEVFTVSVTTTILSTTFVTVPYSSAGSVAEPTSTSSTSSSTSTSRTSTSSSSTTTTTLQTILPPIVSASSPIQVPSLISAPPTTTPSGSLESQNSTSTDSMIGPDTQSQTQKHAVIGGLSGTIAGLIFIGVLICLILRIRRKKPRPEEFCETTDDEKGGFRPLFFRTWTGLSMGSHRPRTAAQNRPESTSSVTVDEDHRIIRMNTRHWPRPFAPGAGEGYRDSAPQHQLRVTNPDLSRPMTPRRSSETPSSFLRKPRSALTGFVLGRASRELPPTITIVDPTLSTERSIAPYAHLRTPSFKSYPSINTLPIIRQQTPEDPFTTPPIHTSNQLGHEQPPQRQAPRRPSLATLQSTATRTWSHLLHPFRARSNTANSQQQTQNVRGTSHFSYTTSGSNSSRRSDPFDLDGPSIRGSHHSPRMGSEFQRRSQINPNWILYEGT